MEPFKTPPPTTTTSLLALSSRMCFSFDCCFFDEGRCKGEVSQFCLHTECSTISDISVDEKKVRCQSCGYRILYKLRTNRPIQHEAR
mmetsp:Transcript_7307/g.18986  ORF Transcript_7307/g.18986 Transcript_7307/m.18986 type:complete len:87 (+) Transcript_7307:148-408(+)